MWKGREGKVPRLVWPLKKRPAAQFAAQERGQGPTACDVTEPFWLGAAAAALGEGEAVSVGRSGTEPAGGRGREE